MLWSAQRMDVPAIAKIAFTALRYFAWRNRHARDERRDLVNRANVA